VNILASQEELCSRGWVGDDLSESTVIFTMHTSQQ